MSDLVKSEPNSTKVTNPSGRGTRGRGKKDAKTMNALAPVTIEVQSIEPESVDTVADKTLNDAAMRLADAEFQSAIAAYDARTNQNLVLFGRFAKQKQASVANAITQHAFETFGVTEEELYGPEADG